MAAANPSPPDVDPVRVAYSSGPSTGWTGWTGWITFASVMMVLLGLFQGIQGLVAIVNDDFYGVTEDGLVVEVDYSVWGWTHLVLGVVILISGIGVLSGNLLARTVGVVLAVVSATVNLVYIEAYPVWSLLIIALDIVVIFALTVHGREVRGA